MRLLGILKAIIQFLPFLVYTIITRPFHIYAYYFDRPSYHKACSSGFKFLLSYVGIKLSIYGAELLPKPGKKFLIVANHQSLTDIPIVSSLIPCAFIQRPIPYIPGISWHFGKLTLIIDRDSPLSILKAVRYVKKVTLDQGIPVTLFPEQTRSIDGTLGDLRLGAATIAKNLNLSVLPITIYNSRYITPKGAIYAKPGTVLMSIHPTINEEFINTHSEKEITQEIRKRLQKGLDYLGQMSR